MFAPVALEYRVCTSGQTMNVSHSQRELWRINRVAYKHHKPSLDPDPDPAQAQTKIRTLTRYSPQFVNNYCLSQSIMNSMLHRASALSGALPPSATTPQVPDPRSSYLREAFLQSRKCFLAGDGPRRNLAPTRGLLRFSVRKERMPRCAPHGGGELCWVYHAATCAVPHPDTICSAWLRACVYTSYAVDTR